METADFYSMEIEPFQAEVDRVWRIAFSRSIVWPYIVAILLLGAVTVARPAITHDAPLAPAGNNSASPK